MRSCQLIRLWIKERGEETQALVSGMRPDMSLTKGCFNDVLGIGMTAEACFRGVS